MISREYERDTPVTTLLIPKLAAYLFSQQQALPLFAQQKIAWCSIVSGLPCRNVCFGVACRRFLLILLLISFFLRDRSRHRQLIGQIIDPSAAIVDDAASQPRQPGRFSGVGGSTDRP
jgi:hypothetical protein